MDRQTLISRFGRMTETFTFSAGRQPRPMGHGISSRSGSSNPSNDVLAELSDPVIRPASLDGRLGLRGHLRETDLGPFDGGVYRRKRKVMGPQSSPQKGQ